MSSSFDGSSTLFEQRWSDSSHFSELGSRWWRNLSSGILRAVWEGIDLLAAEILPTVDWSRDLQEVERQLTQLLETKIRAVMTGFEAYDCQHGSYEYATRMPSPAQPPQYDIAFVLRGNPRLIWPIEAKYIRTATGVNEYVKALRDNFLTGRYAPYCGEGAMLAYLLVGRAEDFFSHVGSKVPCSIEAHPEFPGRTHGQSRHARSIPDGKDRVEEFLCNHLVLELGGTGDLPESGISDSED